MCVFNFWSFLRAQVVIIFFFSWLNLLIRPKEISKLLENVCVCSVCVCFGNFVMCSSGDQVVFSLAKFNDLVKRNFKLLKTCCYICTVSFF